MAHPGEHSTNTDFLDLLSSTALSVPAVASGTAAAAAVVMDTTPSPPGTHSTRPTLQPSHISQTPDPTAASAALALLQNLLAKLSPKDRANVTPILEYLLSPHDKLAAISYYQDWKAQRLSQSAFNERVNAMLKEQKRIITAAKMEGMQATTSTNPASFTSTSLSPQQQLQQLQLLQQQRQQQQLVASLQKQSAISNRLMASGSLQPPHLSPVPGHSTMLAQQHPQSTSAQLQQQLMQQKQKLLQQQQGSQFPIGYRPNQGMTTQQQQQQLQHQAALNQLAAAAAANNVNRTMYAMQSATGAGVGFNMMSNGNPLSNPMFASSAQLASTYRPTSATPASTSAKAAPVPAKSSRASPALSYTDAPSPTPPPYAVPPSSSTAMKTKGGRGYQPLPAKSAKTTAESTARSSTSSPAPAVVDVNALDVDAMMDVTSYTGIDLKAEEDLWLAPSSSTTSQPARRGSQQQARTAPDFLVRGILKREITPLIRAQGIAKCEPEFMDFITEATRTYMATLLPRVLAAVRHRTGLGVEELMREAEESGAQLALVWDQNGDDADGMDVHQYLNRLEREERAAEAQLQAEFPASATPALGDDQPAVAVVIKPAKERKPAGPKKWDMPESVKTKLANTAALLAAGGSLKSWMMPAGEATIGASGAPPIDGSYSLSLPSDSSLISSLNPSARDTAINLSASGTFGVHGAPKDMKSREIGLRDVLFCMEDDPWQRDLVYKWMTVNK